MKKTELETMSTKTSTSGRGLRLQRETLRQLGARSLEQVWGGLSNETVVRPSDACGTPTGGH
jgi:hypothetical protein